MRKPSRESRTITVPEMEDALTRSGYLLESRIERMLTSINYDVTPSWTYPDPETGKTRELDMVALGDQWMDRGAEEESKHVFHWIKYELFIECVNNPQPVVFFTKEDAHAKNNAWSIRYAGQPTEVNTEGGEAQ